MLTGMCIVNVIKMQKSSLPKESIDLVPDDVTAENEKPDESKISEMDIV